MLKSGCGCYNEAVVNVSHENVRPMLLCEGVLGGVERCLPVGFVQGDGNVGENGGEFGCLEDAELKAKVNDVWNVVGVNDAVCAFCGSE